MVGGYGYYLSLEEKEYVAQAQRDANQLLSRIYLKLRHDQQRDFLRIR